MYKRILSYTAVAGAFLVAGAAWAMPNIITAHLQTPGTEKTLLLPAAANHSPVISLGQAVDPTTGEVVEGYAIVHYKDAAAKSNGSRNKGPLCYGFLASGAKWKGTAEPWVVNPDNTRGLDPAAVYSGLGADIAKWEDAADGIVGNSSGINILGDGTITSSTLVADTAAPDGSNEVYFGSVSDPNTIAVTIVWGIFSGPSFQRKLVEWDQVYNEVDYDWSLSGNAGAMDFHNIATHELGHSVGLNDQYNSACSAVTMYGYAGTGEANKQTLETPDITGVSTLY